MPSADSAAGVSVPPAQAGTPARRMPRLQRRKQLLSAAQAVVASRGYHAASMDEIADRAGVSKPVLYQHFPGKLELYLALLEEQAEDLVARMRAALGSTTDNKERVERSIAAYFEFVCAGLDPAVDPAAAQGRSAGSGGEPDHVRAFRLVLEPELLSEPAVRERVERMRADCASLVAAVIAEDTGAPPDTAGLLAVGLMGLADMSARWWLQHGRASIDRAEAVRLLATLQWRGISGFPKSEASGAS